MFSSVSASEYTLDDDYDDWLGRTQRGLLELTAPRVRVILTNLEKTKKTKIRKYEKTKIQNTKYKMQIQNTDCKKK